MKVRTVIHVALLILAISLNAHAQSGHTIRGKVRNQAGVNLSQVTVDLQTGNGSLINQTVTNNEGDFIFSNLTATSYVLIISAPDFSPASEHVDFVREAGPDQPGETRTVEITLAPKGGASMGPATVSFVQDVPVAARATFNRAAKSLKDGKPEQALPLLQEAIVIFPNYFDAHFTLAGELVKAARFDEAIAELEQARRINPKESRVYQLFGVVLMQQQKYAIAAAVFAEASRLNPRDPQLYLSRAVALIEQALSLNPAQSKAAAAERESDFSEAEKNLRHAFDLSDKKLTTVHLQLARIYEKRGTRSRAADELEKYLRETPDAKNAGAIREGIKKLRASSGTTAPATLP